MRKRGKKEEEKKNCSENISPCRPSFLSVGNEIVTNVLYPRCSKDVQAYYQGQTLWTLKCLNVCDDAIGMAAVKTSVKCHSS